MFTKSLVAAAAALLSVGAMILSNSPAEAHYKSYQTGHYVTKVISVPKTISKTYYETVLAGYDDCYEPIYKRVPYTEHDTIYVNQYVRVFVPYADYGYDDAASYSSQY